jgi:hypothetical protein
MIEFLMKFIVGHMKHLKNENEKRTESFIYLLVYLRKILAM